MIGADVGMGGTGWRESEWIDSLSLRPWKKIRLVSRLLAVTCLGCSCLESRKQHEEEEVIRVAFSGLVSVCSVHSLALRPCYA